MATTITIGADTKPACTDAWPMTSAPTILTADPICLGKRTPASRSASKITSINNASTIAGKGTDSLDDEILSSKAVGTVS
ncbi:hypothetical protein D3C80_1703870 [compost metagenome]